MIKYFDKDDLVKLWILVQERYNSTDPTEDKEIKLWVELKRLFEPDVDDELWKSHKHVHDITWRLYDTCRVHHVSTKDGIYIYMLVEKEYPLSRGVLTQMLAANLLVEQNNEMSRELLRKIFMMAERPRRSVQKGSTAHPFAAISQTSATSCVEASSGLRLARYEEWYLLYTQAIPTD
ncbi:hypothetical protein Tco_0250518 [Tanacetum coccineum]